MMQQLGMLVVAVLLSADSSNGCDWSVAVGKVNGENTIVRCRSSFSAVCSPLRSSQTVKGCNLETGLAERHAFLQTTLSPKWTPLKMESFRPLSLRIKPSWLSRLPAAGSASGSSTGAVKSSFLAL